MSGEPDPGALSQFEALRRPAVQADQPPPINQLASELGFQLGSYYPHSIRRVLETADGDRYFAVLGFPRAFSVPAARCLPPALRRQRAKMVHEAQESAKELIYCIAEVGGSGGGGGGPEGAGYRNANCQSFSDIDSGLGLITSDTSRSPVVELVPDGVATVRLTYRDGTAIEATVHTNAFVFTPPQAPIRRAEAMIRRAFRHVSLLLAKRHPTRLQRRRMRHLFRWLGKIFRRTQRALVPRQVTWLDGAGGVLRTIAPHVPASAHGGIIIGG